MEWKKNSAEDIVTFHPFLCQVNVCCFRLTIHVNSKWHVHSNVSLWFNFPGGAVRQHLTHHHWCICREGVHYSGCCQRHWDRDLEWLECRHPCDSLDGGAEATHNIYYRSRNRWYFFFLFFLMLILLLNSSLWYTILKCSKALVSIINHRSVWYIVVTKY